MADRKPRTRNPRRHRLAEGGAVPAGSLPFVPDDSFVLPRAAVSQLGEFAPPIGAIWDLPDTDDLARRAAAMEAVSALVDRRQWALYNGSDGEASDGDR